MRQYRPSPSPSPCPMPNGMHTQARLRQNRSSRGAVTETINAQFKRYAGKICLTAEVSSCRPCVPRNRCLKTSWPFEGSAMKVHACE